MVTFLTDPRTPRQLSSGMYTFHQHEFVFFVISIGHFCHSASMDRVPKTARRKTAVKV